MTHAYERVFFKNIFQQLDSECSLFVLSLCLASNDMVSHLRSLGDGQEEERTYSFPASLAVLREVAKIIKRIDDLPIGTRLSTETRNLLDRVKIRLVPFEQGSLTKETLKPIRDFAFHYDLSKFDDRITGLLLTEMKGEDRLSMRATTTDRSIFRHRYTFADAFRSWLVARYLTKDIVDQVSMAVTDVISFTDSLLHDLSLEK